MKTNKPRCPVAMALHDIKKKNNKVKYVRESDNFIDGSKNLTRCAKCSKNKLYPHNNNTNKIK